MVNGKIIGIDARMIEMSGIGTYIQHLMNRGIYDYAFGIPEIINKYDKNIKVIYFDAPIYSIKEQLGFPNTECKKAKIDLVHFPHYNVSISYQGDYIVTIHDLTHILFPELLGNKIKYCYAKFLIKNAVKRAISVITVSENSKRDIEKYLSVDSKKISITYNAVSGEFCEKSKEQLAYIYNKFGIKKNKKNILYVGNLKVHKNLNRLLNAFANLKNRDEYQLILAGKAFKSLSLEQTELDLGIKQNIVHTGLVSNEDLINLYNVADLFIFPSLYEGFGIPPLEAMACHTAVACSNTSSLPEVVGEAAITFNPENVFEIKTAIETVFNDQSFRNNLIQKGLQQYKKFDWDITANIVKRVIENSFK